MGLADELPDEAVKAFISVLRGGKGGSRAKQQPLHVKDEAQLREAIAAAVGKVPLETLIGAGIQVRAVEAGVMGVPLDDPSIPDGWHPEGVLVLVRGEDPDGNRSIYWRDGGSFSLWEMLGAMDCCGEAVRGQIAAARA